MVYFSVPLKLNNCKTDICVLKIRDLMSLIGIKTGELGTKIAVFG